MRSKPPLTILLCAPRGFCAGVDRAIQIVEEALSRFGPPVYVRHEIVHNRHVVDGLRAKGAVFVDELDEIPDTGQPVIFSAHGVAKRVPQEAGRRGLFHLDATCPLVSKVHKEAILHHRRGREIVLVGHAGHPEVEGTMGRFDARWGGRIHLVEVPEDVAGLEVRDPVNVAFVTQTTLSMDDTARVIDAVRARFPEVACPRKEDICYATQNRQDAVRALAGRVDVMLLVGSPNSSNSNRLREMAEREGARAWLVDGPEDLEREWFEGVDRVGVTAGASAPEVLVQRVVGRLREWGGVSAEETSGKAETVTFSLPRLLRERRDAQAS
jgi:4-hydroxy-3-methylbut-2-en-1-yl diphosphate reductase